MKIKISKYGGLEIERAGEMLWQECMQDRQCPCNINRCPAFREPVVKGISEIYIYLQGCFWDYQIKSENFTDERGKM